MGSFVEFESGAGPTRAYLSSTQGEKQPGILLCHAWWGLTDFFTGLTDRIAGEGFTVLAPDLYGGRTASTIKDAEALINTLNPHDAIKREQAALDYLLSLPQVAGNKVGAIGFSMGASYATWLAGLRPEIAAVVLFYGGGEQSPTYANETSAAHMGHFAPNDEWESDDAIHALEAGLKTAGRTADFHFYPGTTHWFFESNRPDAYNAEAAQLAWERTIGFLNATLKGQDNA
jgi:carboxymethylenebutenolidase